MSAVEDFRLYFAECPLVAIIRGVTPGEAEGIAGALYEGGIRIIEVPLNSPQPLESIRIIAEKFGDRTLVGAGTVLDPDDVARVKDAGGRLIVAPNTDICQWLAVCSAWSMRRLRRSVRRARRALQVCVPPSCACKLARRWL